MSLRLSLNAGTKRKAQASASSPEGSASKRQRVPVSAVASSLLFGEVEKVAMLWLRCAADEELLEIHAMTFEGPRCRDRLELSRRNTTSSCPHGPASISSNSEQVACLMSRRFWQDVMMADADTVFKGSQRRCRRNGGAYDRGRFKVCGSTEKGAGQTVRYSVQIDKLDYANNYAQWTTHRDTVPNTALKSTISNSSDEPCRY